MSVQAKVSAINPICNIMNFEYKYGEEVCNSTCGVQYKPPIDPRRRKSTKPFGRTTSTTTTSTAAPTTSPAYIITTTPELENKTCEYMDTKLISSEPATSLGDISTWEQCANLCAANDNCSHWNFYANNSREVGNELLFGLYQTQGEIQWCF